MARYRALGPLYLRRLIVAGEEFESELPPGRNWEPLDEEARAAVAKYRSGNARVLSVVERLEPTPSAFAAVQIPDDWRELSAQRRRWLAQKLGAQSNVKAADANTYIEAELERRAQKAA
jgi:hypothetical protein